MRRGDCKEIQLARPLAAAVKLLRPMPALPVVTDGRLARPGDCVSHRGENYKETCAALPCESLLNDIIISLMAMWI